MDVDALNKAMSEPAYAKALSALDVALDAAEWNAESASDHAPSQRKREYLKSLADRLTELRLQLRAEIGETP